MAALQSFELSILIPCYNNFEGLMQSLNSIVYDSKNYVIVIVDDGSTEPVTAEKISLNNPNNLNVIIINFKKNQGITKALNAGLELIYTNFNVMYIARLDCGDICSVNRFPSQTSFLNNNPDINLIGSWCYFKETTSGEAYKYITPTRHKNISRSMYFRNVFIHPTVMWRLSGVNKLKYPEKYPAAEDYGFFYDIVTSNKSAILNEFLVTCEINPNGLSMHNRAVQLHSRLRVISDYGKNKFLVLLGTIKLKILMILPYQLVLNAKKMLFKI